MFRVIFRPLKFFAKNFAPLKKHSNRVSGLKKDRPLRTGFITFTPYQLLPAMIDSTQGYFWTDTGTTGIAWKVEGENGFQLLLRNHVFEHCWNLGHRYTTKSHAENTIELCFNKPPNSWKREIFTIQWRSLYAYSKFKDSQFSGFKFKVHYLRQISVWNNFGEEQPKIFPTEIYRHRKLFAPKILQGLFRWFFSYKFWKSKRARNGPALK